jgi:hypothetical protein
MSLVKKAGESLYTVSLIFSEQIFFYTLISVETSLPIMPRTEAVSVALSSLVREGIWLPIRALTSSFLAMTKIRKDKGLYLNV